MQNLVTSIGSKKEKTNTLLLHFIVVFSINLGATSASTVVVYLRNDLLLSKSSI